MIELLKDKLKKTNSLINSNNPEIPYKDKLLSVGSRNVSTGLNQEKNYGSKKELNSNILTESKLKTDNVAKNNNKEWSFDDLEDFDDDDQ